MTESPPAAATRDIDLLCLGAPLMTFTETAPGRYLRALGEGATLTAIAAARAGARVSFASRVGADVFGTTVEAALVAEGIDHTHLIRDRRAPTGHVFSHLADLANLARPGGPDGPGGQDGSGGQDCPDRPGGPGDPGDAAVAMPADTAASLMRPGDVSSEAIQAARVVHLSGTFCGLSRGARALAGDAMHEARALGTLVSLTLDQPAPGQRNPDAQRAALALLPTADIALLGIDAAAAAFGVSAPEAVLDHVLGLGPQVVALRMGDKGAWVASTQGRWRIGPMAVLATDLSGAASTFDGYFLSGLTAGDDLLMAATRANMASAISTTRAGAADAIPLADEVMI